MSTIHYKVNFIVEEEGTYVVDVAVNDKNFAVNCQTYLTRDLVESSGLTCYNESGGDFYDSGLAQYLESIGIEESSDQYNEIVTAIEECAECQLPENSVLRIIQESEYDYSYEHDGSLFGAFGPADVRHESYVNDDFEIVVTSEDTTQNRAENKVLGYKKFADVEEFNGWRSRIYGDDHHGNCSISYRAWQDICTSA